MRAGQITRRLVLLLAVFAAGTIDAGAADPDFIGPVRVRDLSPISMLRLDFVPAHACSDDASLSVLRVDYSEANVFILSGAVEQYLERRNRTAPLTRADIDALARGREDFFVFDAELSFIDIEYIRALSKRTQIRIEWPILSRGGGFLDHSIEQFHSHTGLRSAGRNLVDRDDVNIAARINGARFGLHDSETHTAAGDPTISLSQSFPAGRNTHVIVEGAAKVALGGERNYFSSGASDFGVQVSAETLFRRDALYAGLNFVRVGDGRVFGVFRLSNSVTGMAAAERRISSRTWIIAQTTWSRETLKPETHSPLDEDRIQVTGGIRRKIGRSVITTVALTENVAHYKNTPDIGVHVSLAWLLSR